MSFPRGRILLVGLVVLAGWRVPAGAESPPGAVPFELRMQPAGSITPRTIAAWEREGVLYLSAGDLALLTGAPKHWRSELGRMTFTFRDHHAAVTDGSDIAVIDESKLLHLPGPAFLWEGQLLIPLQLVVTEEGEAREWVDLAVSFSREDRTIGASAGPGVSIAAILEEDESGWNLILRTETPVRYELVQSNREGFLLRLLDAHYDPHLYPLPRSHRWFQDLRLRNRPQAVEVSFTPAQRVVGYRVVSHRPHGIEIYLGIDERDVRTGRLRPFAETGRARVETLRTVVLLAGHGGGDPGVQLGDDAEEQLTLEVCRMAAERIRNILGLEVVIARSPKPGQDPGIRPGHGEGDAMISVHFHRRPGGPAAFVPRSRGEPGTTSPTLESLGFVPATGVPESGLTPSRLLARSILDAVSGRLNQAGMGIYTESLNEWMGANMPAMALELGEGESGWPRTRLSQIAAGVAEGVRLYSLALENQQ